MAFTKLTKDMNIIQKLDDEPNDVGGLTAAELKAKFDEPANAVKDWINNTFIPEAEEALHDARLENLPEHAFKHAANGADPITPSDIGAVPVGWYDGDLDQLTADGHYRLGGNVTNGPSCEYTWCQVIVVRGTISDNHAQLLIDADGGLHVRRYWYNAWTGWKRLATTDYAVKKSGDTMTGHLDHLDTNNSGRAARTAFGTTGYATLINRLDSANYNGIRIFPETAELARALIFGNNAGGNPKEFAILGEHNKPAGSYTGNGDAATRAIDTGGIGNVIAITSANALALISLAGGVQFNNTNGTVTHCNKNEINFTDGILTIATASFLNTYGAIYNYQVL